MARFSSRQAGGSKARGARARVLLGPEIELMMREHQRLLRTTGAAAALVSALDLRVLPRSARAPVRRLGALLDAMPDETLADALEALHGTATAARAGASG